jgi:oxygen-independent coproporphyrinogen-3 oxidase
MVGLGCGARSYTRSLHYGNEYAVGARAVEGILGAWVDRPDASFDVADWGHELDGEDQRRRWAILSLLSDEGLDARAWRARFGADPLDELPELAELVALELAAWDGATLRLRPAGVERSDVIGPWLCSARVSRLMTEAELR